MPFGVGPWYNRPVNFLTDSEWLQLVETIGLVNATDDDRAFRSRVLESIRILIPYDSAAFFLTDRSRLTPGRAPEDASAQPGVGSASFSPDPVGIDVNEGKLEEYIDSAWRSDELRDGYSLYTSSVFRESDVIAVEQRDGDYYHDYLDELYILTCNLACARGPLGSFNLNRTREHGDFTNKEVQILRILEPHITGRLERRQLTSAGTSLSKEDFFERYHITNREQDIIYCLVQGMTNNAISQALCISSATTKKHLENIFKKTQVGSRLELISLLNGDAFRVERAR